MPEGKDYKPQLFREAAGSEYESGAEYSGFQIHLLSAPSNPGGPWPWRISFLVTAARLRRIYTGLPQYRDQEKLHALQR